MNEKEKAKKIIKILNRIYPKAPVPLKHKNIFKQNELKKNFTQDMHHFKSELSKFFFIIRIFKYRIGNQIKIALIPTY